MMVLVMNNHNLKKIILILAFLCFTKDAAKSPKKITNSNQKKSFAGLSVFLKPFQAKKVEKINMEDYQKNTMEWVRKRLNLFTQILDEKIFNKMKDVNPKTTGVNKLKKVPDKKTVFSWQWQDMKSHYLIPMSKRHNPVYFYTDETSQQLKEIKEAFFKSLEQYSIKLQILWNEKAKIKIDDDPYDVVDNPNFDPNKDLIAQKTVLHNEMLSLLKDLPQTLMYWRSTETELLRRFGEQYGPLPTKDTIEQQRKNFGTNVKGAKVFTAAELDEDEEEDSSEKEESSDSDSSSSDSSSSGSGSDYDTDFFNNLTRDYFISDNETVDHNEPPNLITIPPQLNDHTNQPSDNPTESDNETHKKLNTFQGDTDWQMQSAIARDRQEDENEQQKNKGQSNKLNSQMELLKEQLFQSLMDIYKNEEQRKIIQESQPGLIAVIEQLKELESQEYEPEQPSPHSHLSESSSPNHFVENGSGRNTDHSIQKSPPKVEEIVRPSVQTRIAEPSSDPPISRRLQPDPVHDPKGTGGPPRPAPLPSPIEPGDRSGISDVNAEMSVKQEKSSK